MSSITSSAHGSLLPIDFHCHFVPARFELTIAKSAPAAQQTRWLAIARKLADEELLTRDMREGALRARVINIPLGLIADPEGLVPHADILSINDEVAEICARHPDQLFGLASVDAYDGERSARELERAVLDLNLRGVFVDCARGDLLIDAPQARPTLEAAASLGVPVFVHPVAPQPLTRQMARYGVIGSLFARGTVNAAALIALVEGQVFQSLPHLQVVVTGHAISGLAMLTGLSDESCNAGGAVRVLRNHVFVDTQMIHPALIRASVDLLGCDRVMAGSDWPIVDEGPIRERLGRALRGAGLDTSEQQAITVGNCLRLMNALGRS